MNKHIDKDSRYRDKCTYLYNFTPNVEVDVTQKGKYILFLAGFLSRRVYVLC